MEDIKQSNILEKPIQKIEGICSVFKLDRLGYSQYRRSDVRLPFVLASNIRLTSIKETTDPYFRIFIDTNKLDIGNYLVHGNLIFFVLKIESDRTVIIVKTNINIDLKNKEEILIYNLPVFISSDHTKLLMPYINKTEPRLEDLLLTKTRKCYVIEKAVLRQKIWNLEISHFELTR